RQQLRRRDDQRQADQDHGVAQGLVQRAVGHRRAGPLLQQPRDDDAHGVADDDDADGQRQQQRPAHDREAAQVGDEQRDGGQRRYGAHAATGVYDAQRAGGQIEYVAAA